MTPTEQCERDADDVIRNAGTGLHAAIQAFARACAREGWQLGRASVTQPDKRPLAVLPQAPPEMQFYVAPYAFDPPETQR